MTNDKENPFHEVGQSAMLHCFVSPLQKNKKKKVKCMVAWLIELSL